MSHGTQAWEKVSLFVEKASLFVEKAWPLQIRAFGVKFQALKHFQKKRIGDEKTHGNKHPESLQLHPSPLRKLDRLSTHMPIHRHTYADWPRYGFPLMFSMPLKAHAKFPDLSRELPKGLFDVVSRHAVGFEK